MSCTNMKAELVAAPATLPNSIIPITCRQFMPLSYPRLQMAEAEGAVILYELNSEAIEHFAEYAE